MSTLLQRPGRESDKARFRYFDLVIGLKCVGLAFVPLPLSVKP